MNSSIAIDIDAPPELVFALARRVEDWSSLLPHYSLSHAATRRTDGSLVIDFVAHRPLLSVLGLGLPVRWRSRTWSEPDRMRLRFVHTAGVTRGMNVTWRIEPRRVGSAGLPGSRPPGSGRPPGTRVTIEHDFRPRLPGLASFVDRWFTSAIAARTLGTFKVLAETLATPSSPATAATAATAATPGTLP